MYEIDMQPSATMATLKTKLQQQLTTTKFTEYWKSQLKWAISNCVTVFFVGSSGIIHEKKESKEEKKG